MKHYELVTKQASEMLSKLERERPNLSIEQVRLRSKAGMDVIWTSIKEATQELCEMEGIYKCLEAIHDEALRGVPAPGASKPRKNLVVDRHFLDQLRALPKDKIQELIYNLGGLRG